MTASSVGGLVSGVHRSSSESGIVSGLLRRWPPSIQIHDFVSVDCIVWTRCIGKGEDCPK